MVLALAVGGCIGPAICLLLESIAFKNNTLSTVAARARECIVYDLSFCGCFHARLKHRQLGSSMRIKHMGIKRIQKTEWQC